MSSVGWASHVALLCTAALTTFTVVDSQASAKASQLLEALDAALAEEDARKILDPYMESLKSLESQVVEKIVMRQWWGLARDVVAKSHKQQVDLSFAVRKAVRALKDEADELLRTLNPKYGQAQQVSPAFQWAQNDTCVFLTIKYTVRWNAPGALEVTDPAVNMSENMFNFTGLGKHSNNKYRYALSLSLFDLILSASSSWSAASVGKLSVTLRKRWPRKWPRLLANKKTKIGNMHVWMEMQEKLDSTLGGMTTVSNSPVTCSTSEKLYCLATDTCKKAENCSQCPGKTIPVEELHVCTGMPTEKASLSFKDADMDEHQVGGDVKIFKARNEFDIDSYVVYFGKDERTKLESADGQPALVGEAAPTGSDTEVKIPFNTAIPESATHLLVFSKNEYGEFSTPGNAILRDAAVPKGKPTSLAFEDEDGNKGEVGGTVTIGRAEDEAQVEDYALHWGKSATRKIASSSLLREVKASGSKDLTHYVTRGTKIPDGATHLLAYTKNEHGENPSAVTLKIVDHLKPCLAQSDPDCPAGVKVSADADPEPGRAQVTLTVEKAGSDVGVGEYALYWGRQSCGADGGQSGAKNGHIRDVPSDGTLSVALPIGTVVPADTTHVLVFSKNKYGESDFCTSSSFEDNQSAEKKEL
mmetsp:Transcript_23009/g.72852  ORF Transcript_23009/g.72852 Transcript_23009/m.72852 type:complete len:643 (+) Transcript_23009:44-1972(+)